MSEVTYWSQPNQQVVRNGEPVGIVEAGPDPMVSDSTFDPGAHTVAEVLDYVEEHPGEMGAVLAAERSGKARTTLLSLGDDSE